MKNVADPKGVKIEVNTTELYFALVHLQDKCRAVNPFLGCILYQDDDAIEEVVKDRSDMAVVDVRSLNGRVKSKSLSTFDLGDGIAIYWKDKTFGEIKHWFVEEISSAIKKKAVQM